METARDWDPEPQLFAECLPWASGGVLELIERAIGEHYDVRVIEVPEKDSDGHEVLLDGGRPLIIDRLILISKKGERAPKLTLWTTT